MAVDDNDRTESVGDLGDGPDRPRIKRLGHFRIDVTLGSGGMGTIYRAYDESMKRPVALKVLHSSLEVSQRAQSRFVREAWVAGQLDHPNIVKVYSRGEENKASYLAMELAEGGSLSDLVKRTRESIPSGSDVTGTIDREYINDILGKFVELAGALEHIHSKGFIHRDIKPHNILLSDPDKKFKFTDFGIAHAEDMTRMTRPGDFIGTVKYMSPELIAAQRGEVDKRTDIYSLGVTLYEALTLTLPFKADSEEKLISEILAGHYIEARKTNRRISRDLETVLMKATHHDPDMRYQTATEFADDLQRLIDGRPIVAKRQSLFSRGIKYLKRNYKAASIILFSVVVVVVGFVWQFRRMQKTDHEELSIRRVWSGHGIFSSGPSRISPDGRFVSFTDARMGDLSILELASKEIRLLTNNWPVWGAVFDTVSEKRRVALTDSLMMIGRMAIGSVWSPDASQLAYGSISIFQGGDLCLIGRDGADTLTLIAANIENMLFLAPYDWSKEGENILAGAPAGEDSTKLMIISANDGSARELDTVGTAPWDFQSGYFSPDGRYVAYTSAENDIFLLSLDGKSHKPLIQHPARDYLLGWSPDGRWICFASDRSGTTDVWVIRVIEGEPRGEPRKVSRDIGEIILLGMTYAGSLYYGLESENIDVYVAEIDPQAGKLVTPPEKATRIFEGTNQWPDWSPDGKYLLYRWDRKGADHVGALTPSPLCEREMETGKVREVFVQLVFAAHHYSPDGRSAIAHGTDVNNKNGLFQIDLESGQTTMLVKCADDTRIRWVTWSPDSKKLFYEEYRPMVTEPATRLVQYDLETQQEKVLFREPSWPTCPALSPDGQWLAFQILDDEKRIRSLNIMPADSGFLREIVRLEEDECVYSVDWMPDGKSILYIKNTPDHPKQRELWQVAFEGGGPRNLGLTMEKMAYLSIHPDGRQIAFSSYKEQTEIWVMENFLPED